MASKCNLRLIRRCWMVEYGVKGVTLIDTFLDSTWFIRSMYFRNALPFLIDCFCIDVFAPANLFLTSAVYNGMNFLCMITDNPSKWHYIVSNIKLHENIFTFLTRWRLDSILGLSRHSKTPSSVVLAFLTRKMDLILFCLESLKRDIFHNMMLAILEEAIRYNIGTKGVLNTILTFFAWPLFCVNWICVCHFDTTEHAHARSGLYFHRSLMNSLTMRVIRTC